MTNWPHPRNARPHPLGRILPSANTRGGDGMVSPKPPSAASRRNAAAACLAAAACPAAAAYPAVAAAVVADCCNEVGGLGGHSAGGNNSSPPPTAAMHTATAQLHAAQARPAYLFSVGTIPVNTVRQLHLTSTPLQHVLQRNSPTLLNKAG